MPRNKTFRKRKHDKIQKGGAFNMSDSNFPKIDSSNSTKYYAYVVKTRKAVGGGGSSSSSSSSGSSSGSSSIGRGGGGGGGGGGSAFVIAVPNSLPEYEYKTTIIDETQKKEICADNSGEKTKIIKSTGAGAGNLNQFVEKNTGDEVITIFELNSGNQTTLSGLTITKENVKWNDFVAC
jgi:hypothetical protein